MKNLLDKIRELESRDFDVVVSRGSLALHQTQRNLAKAEIVDALYKDIKEALEEEGYDIYQSAAGPIVEFLNPKVEDQIIKMGEKDRDMYTGFISIQLDAVMKNLDTNGMLEESDYILTMEEKAEKAAAREKTKQTKIRRDAELRAEKNRQREEEIARLKIAQETKKDNEGN